MPRAVVLLSGGLDSATTLAIAKDSGYECYCLSFNYGQRHDIELDKAKQIASAMGAASHKVVTLDIGQFGGSALTDDNIEVPKDVDTEEIPVTYVPARNTILLSIALGYAETIDAKAIFIGANAVDYSGYPDCRPEFIQAFAEVARLGTKEGVEGRPITIEAPLIDLTKAEIIKKGTALGVPYELTWSCYSGGEKACGHCDSCRLRLKGFAEAGLKDPVPYEV